MKHITLLAGLAISIGASAQITDGSFEGSFADTTIWHQHSTNFGTPMCDAGCSTNPAFAPHSGTIYAWFGGAASTQTLPEIGTLSQAAVIPTGASATLAMWVKLPSGGTAADYFYVSVDGIRVDSLHASDTTAYRNYTAWGIDVTAYANGASHYIGLVGKQSVAGTASFNVVVDDVSILANGSSIGIFENESLPGFQAYPNPANDELTLSFNAMHGAAVITIADASGRVVSTRTVGEVNRSTLICDTHAFSGGVYMVNVQQSGKSFQQRVVIAH